MEDDWLRGWKGFLLGENIDEQMEKQLNDVSAQICKSLKKELNLTISQSLMKVNFVLIIHADKFSIVIYLKHHTII